MARVILIAALASLAPPASGEPAAEGAAISTLQDEASRAFKDKRWAEICKIVSADACLGLVGTACLGPKTQEDGRAGAEVKEIRLRPAH